MCQLGEKRPVRTVAPPGGGTLELQLATGLLCILNTEVNQGGWRELMMLMMVTKMLMMISETPRGRCTSRDLSGWNAAFGPVRELLSGFHHTSALANTKS